MSAIAWLSIAASGTGLVASLLLTLVIMGLKILHSDVVVLGVKVDNLSNRIGLLEQRVQAVEVVLMKAPM